VVTVVSVVRKAPTWLRVLSVVLGLAALMLGMVVLFLPGLQVMHGPIIHALDLQLLLLSGGVILIGILQLLPSLALPKEPQWARAIDIFLGVVIVLLGVLALVMTRLAIHLLVYMLAFGILANGISDFLVGALPSDLPDWYRSLSIIFGVFMVLIFVVIMVAPMILLAPLIPLILSFALILLGFEHLFAGITGEY